VVGGVDVQMPVEDAVSLFENANKGEGSHYGRR
jgi:hypothetical protein